MRKRIEAGTDIAMIGAWDISRNAVVLTENWGRKYEDALERDTRAGHLFLIHLGGDGGGPIDVFVDEEIPPSLQKHVTRKPSEFLLRIPTGRLMIGGVEDYRSAKTQITGEESMVKVPFGDYLLTCFVGEEEAELHQPTQAELEQAVGAEDLRYIKRIDRNGCLGYLTFLLFPALCPLVGWIWALIITVIVVPTFFYIREVAFLNRNQRYQRINKAINAAHLAASAKDSPILVFQLRKVDYTPELKGGSLRLSQVPS